MGAPDRVTWVPEPHSTAHERRPPWEPGVGLLHALIVLTFSIVAGVLMTLALGEAALTTQFGVLGALLVQQLLVVLTLTLYFALATGQGTAVLIGAPATGKWWLAAALLAPAFVLLQSPALDVWGALTHVTPPDWYDRAVALNGVGRTLLVFFAVAIVPPLCEELLFRGYLQWRFRSLGPAGAIALQAALFTLFHFDLYGLPVYFLSGLLLGSIRHFSAALWPCVLIHAANNGLSILDLARGESLYELMGVWGLVAALALAFSGALVAFSAHRERVTEPQQ